MRYRLNAVKLRKFLARRGKDAERFRTLVDKSNDFILLIEVPSGKIVDVNESACRQRGSSREEFLSMTIYDLCDLCNSGDLPKFLHNPDAFEENQKTVTTVLMTSSRVPMLVEFTFSLAKFDEQPYVIAIARDITQRLQAEEDLLKSEAKNRALLDAIPDLMVVINRHGRFLDFKPAKGYVLLVPPEDFLGATVNQIWPAELAERIMHFAHLALKTGATQSFEYELPVRGKINYQEARLVASGESEVLILFRDITERRQMEERLKFISMHDALTGAYNRIFLDQEVHRLNNPSFAPVGVIICDLDGLKLVNDSFGHDVGDFFLQKTANILNACFPDNNVVRIGEDEFCVLFPNTSLGFLEAAYQKIRDSVKLHNSANPEIILNMSSGYAITSGNTKTVRHLIKEAEHNMGREKLHRIESTRSAIVQTLVKALEARDFITEGHGDRLQDLVEEQGRALGLPEQKLADLRLLGQFHDIGKVGIPDRILFKPGRLTTEERIEIQRHCEIGHRIALSSPDLVPIAEGILKHHEWWDGSGYPLGLKGEEIPVECRILSIADAYDAMTNDRPYRKGMSPEEAAARLREAQGTQFDPRLVEVFIELARQ